MYDYLNSHWTNFSLLAFSQWPIFAFMPLMPFTQSITLHTMYSQQVNITWLNFKFLIFAACLSSVKTLVDLVYTQLMVFTNWDLGKVECNKNGKVSATFDIKL